MAVCPLCQHDQCSLFFEDPWRRYWRCAQCHLTFVDGSQLPSRETEKGQYDLHDNRPDDPGYRRFLSQITTPLNALIAPASKGLDFGCGPGPALAIMQREEGHHVTLYDPMYYPDRDALNQVYDFVTCTEVVEHLHQPRQEWDHFDRLVTPGGWLAIMTRFLDNDAAFERWHYRRDPTHVCFWQPDTFAWLAAQRGWRVHRCDNPVVLMQKR